MTDAFRIADPYRGVLPPTDRPLLVVMLTGWIDASNAAAAAMDVLVDKTAATTIVEFDPDTYIDYRARRPIMELRLGVNTRLDWVAPKLMLGRDRNGRDILLLTGAEPDANWQRFAREVERLAGQLGVRRMLGLGAYPVATPHTRRVKMSCTCPSESLTATLPYIKSSLDAPAGVESVLEHALTRAGIDAIGLWAQVPHYVSSMPYPASTLALLNAVNEVGNVDVDVSDVRDVAETQRDRLDRLVNENPEHAAMLTQLEQAFDAAQAADETLSLDEDLPNGDQLAAELEQFLRQHRSDS
jgi:proteasome assembly chaperone (PAC2) family protein